MFFRKTCELCGEKIEKGKEVLADVKVPEFKGFSERSFCSCEHAEKYIFEVKGTKRTKFCPTCAIGN
jgi:hypothetical protein